MVSIAAAESEEAELLIWGGQDLVHMKPTANLAVLKETKTRSAKMAFDVTVIESPRQGGTVSKEVQKGDVPQGNVVVVHDEARICHS